MITSPNMGLIIWNASSDAYNSEEQGENWAKVDQHDHTPGKGAPIGTGALADAAVTAEKLAPDAIPSVAIVDGSVTAVKLATDSVQTVKIVNNAVTDAKLASPSNAVYRNVFDTWFEIAPSASVATYAATRNTSLGTIDLATTNAATLYPVNIRRIVGTDHSVASKATNFRIRAGVQTGSTPPGMNYTFKLVALSITGNAYTLGSVAGSTTVTTPGASALTPATSSDFTVSDGYYILAVTTSATSSAVANCFAQLQVHNT